MLNFKSYYDLSRDIAANAQRLPQVDLVVGIPKSGLIPATVIASFLNLSMVDLDSFLFSYAKRKGVRREGGRTLEKQRVLIVDDSVNTGSETRRVRRRIIELQDDFEFVFCAVYGVAEDLHKDTMDLVLTYVPHPRFFQWNYRNHIAAEHACFDMDGVLCIDPPEDKNDDGELYRDFILNAPQLFIPKKKISSIVTSRLERFRPETEEWLANNDVAYGELIMLDLPSAEERRRLRAHAPFKSEVYASRDELLFVESNWKQAKAIALATDKPVMCTENDCFLANSQNVRDIGKTKRLFSYDQINLENQLRLEISDLTERLSRTDPQVQKPMADLQTFVAKRNRAASPLEKERVIQKARHAKPNSGGEIDPKTATRRILMISRTFNGKFGAGAAVSSGRLRAAMAKHGAEVFTLSTDELEVTPNQKAARPLSETHIGFWSHWHDTEHSRLLNERIEQINPDVIVLGAVDNGIISPLDVAKIKRPIVWVLRDNWAHTGGCLFKLEPEAQKVTADIGEAFMTALTCEGYKHGCADCPALKHPEEQQLVANLQYLLKSLAFGYRSDIVFAPISDWLRKMASSAPLIENHLICTVRNPIDLKAVKRLAQSKTDLRIKLDLPQDAPLVLLNAHSLKNPRKGLSLVLDALKSAKSLNDVHFVTVGQTDLGSVPAALRARFHGFGFIEDPKLLLEVFNAVDVVLVPALQESLSVVASDAICTGTPVVCFAVGGLTELVDHKVNGWLAPAFDTHDLLQGLAWVLFEADKKALSEACIKKAKATLDGDANVERLFALMDTATEQFKEIGPIPESIVSATDLLGEVHKYQMFQRRHIRHLEKRSHSTKADAGGRIDAAAYSPKPKLGFVIRGELPPRHLTQVHRIATYCHNLEENYQVSLLFENPQWADRTWVGSHLKKLDYLNVVASARELPRSNRIEVSIEDNMLVFRTNTHNFDEKQKLLASEAPISPVQPSKAPKAVRYFLSANVANDVDRLNSNEQDTLLVVSKKRYSWMMPLGTGGLFKATLPCDARDSHKAVLLDVMSENDLFDALMLARYLGKEPWRVRSLEIAKSHSMLEIASALSKASHKIEIEIGADPGLLHQDLSEFVAQIVATPSETFILNVPGTGLSFAPKASVS